MLNRGLHVLRGKGGGAAGRSKEEGRRKKDDDGAESEGDSWVQDVSRRSEGDATAFRIEDDV